MKEPEDDGGDRYQKYVLTVDDGKKVHATCDIYLAILEAARTTRRCARFAHHGTFSADDEGKHGRSVDLSRRTNACRPQDTHP